MWNRAGGRSAALERAKAQLSGLRVTSSRTLNQYNPRTDPSNVSFGGLPQSRQAPLQDLSDLSSEAESGKQVYETGPAETIPRPAEAPVQSGMRGGSRFLKKAASSGKPSVSHPDRSDRAVPQQSSQSAALSRLALIEDRIRNRHINQADYEAGTGLGAAGGTSFLKKKAFGEDEADLQGTRRSSCVAPVRTTRGGKEISLESDEEDMHKLLGESPLDSSDSISIVRQTKTCTQPHVKTSRKTTDQVVKSAGPLQEGHTLHHVRTPSPYTPPSKTPSPNRPFSREAEINKRSLSSGSGHSDIRSLEELFPVTSDHDDTLSERSLSEDFKLNVMTLDDLAPLGSPSASATLTEKIKASASVSKNPSLSPADVISQDHSLKSVEGSAQYESDFESEIQTEMERSRDEISERLSNGPEPQSRSFSAKSQTDNDYSLSEESSSLRSERFSESESSLCYSRDSSNVTVTHTEPRLERRSRKDATVQTQADGLSYTWSLGQAVLGPSVGMTYVDPTPVASHIISAEAVEALSAYSPAVFALNDMLRQQLTLTRCFIQSNRRLHQSTLESLGPADYTYTTLEETKEFIRCNRPTRLTMEDALEEVLQEMREYHYI